MTHQDGDWRGLVILIALFALPILGSMARPDRQARAAQPQAQCFPETPHCLSDLFAAYWSQNGGLPVFGFPITAAADEPNRDTGKTYLTQWVERNRLEDHPENQGTPYRILLGLLGKDRLAQLGRDWAGEPRESGPQASCLWFAETGHNVCDQEQGAGFKTYWETNGLAIPVLDRYARSLQLFGLPLTAPKMETNSSGDTVLTQWFERARFEWHPGNPAEFKVLLGLLGKEVLATTTPMPLPTTTATPTATLFPTPTTTSTATKTPTPRNVSPTPQPRISPTPRRIAP